MIKTLILRLKFIKNKEIIINIKLKRDENKEILMMTIEKLMMTK